MTTKIEAVKGPLKTGIISYGTRISLDSKNVRSVDLHYMREYLLDVLDRKEVDFISKKTKSENDLPYFKDILTTDFNDYDEIYIYNSSLNPFGGVFKYESLLAFEKLYNYNGKVIYLLCDPKMPPLDFSKFIQYKSRCITHCVDKVGEMYHAQCDNKSMSIYKLPASMVDSWTEKVYNNMQVAYTGSDYELYLIEYNKRAYKLKDVYHRANYGAEWFNFWLFEYYAVNEKLEEKLHTSEKNEHAYDLMYFGNNRHNERNKIIQCLYDIPEYNKLFIGFDPELTNTEIVDYMSHTDLFDTISKNCLATVIVGDNLHNNNVRTPRFFEAMLLNVVAFIYTKFDSNKTYVRNEFLKDFIYVSDKEELKNKIAQIKADKELYKKIVELERQEILEQFNEYKKQ